MIIPVGAAPQKRNPKLKNACVQKHLAPPSPRNISVPGPGPRPQAPGRSPRPQAPRSQVPRSRAQAWNKHGYFLCFWPRTLK